MSTAPALVALLTDFGHRDAYVAAMKGVILGQAPQTQFLDITHDIGPQDIRHGALVLEDIWPFLPDGTVVVAVVDPGVGTDRRLLMARVPGRRLALLAPDNGLMDWALHGQQIELFDISKSPRARAPVAPTFHGRDILAPVAAALVNGEAPAVVGVACGDVLVELERPALLKENLTIHGEVVCIDQFGNLVSSIRHYDLPSWIAPELLRFEVGGVSVMGLSKSYGAVSSGGLCVAVGGFGRLEAAVCNGSAAQVLGVNRQMSIPFTVRW